MTRDGDRPRLRVVADGSALLDSRRRSGMGRYVESLLPPLAALDEIDLKVARPRRAPAREYWFWRFMNAQPAIREAARAHHADVVHCLTTDPSVAAPLDRQVVTVLDVVPWREPKRMTKPDRVFLSLQKGRFRRCAGIIAISDAVAEEATDTLSLEPTRVHVIGLGVADVFAPQRGPRDDDLRRRAGAGESGYVLWVGTMRFHDPRKALDVLLDAVGSLPDRTRPRLVLVGAHGDGSRRLAARAEDAGLAVTMPGYVDDETLAALYRGAALVALPSLHEGFGLTALEAMACGAPLVASRAGNLRALAGDAALTVEPGDVRALAAALDAVLNDEARRATMRTMGPRIARSYRWPAVAQATLDVYRNASRRRR